MEQLSNNKGQKGHGGMGSKGRDAVLTESHPPPPGPASAGTHRDLQM